MRARNAFWRFVAGSLIASAVMLVGVGAAAAGQFTTVYTGNLSGVKFAVKPAQMEMDSADGGLLKIKWPVWNGLVADGYGTSQPDHGTYAINVTLSDPNWGTFQRLTITFHNFGGKKTVVDALDLGEQHDSPTFLAWATAAWIKNTGASGLDFFTPNLNTGCDVGSAIGVSQIGGLFGINGNAACAVANRDYAARGLKLCGGGQLGHSVLKSYDGYTVTNEYPSGIFFERGSSYFTLSLACPGE